MIRNDFQAIAKWIAPNSQVLDLGCGDGSFLQYLQEHKTGSCLWRRDR